MANYKKSFNFRNGVQVDEDNLIVNSNGLVGIGTSVPTEVLDVRGTTKVVGLVTANHIFTTALNVTGVGTFGTVTDGKVRINSGIVTAVSGVVTFYGDGRGLVNIPTSQWTDVDVGLGFTSIYAAGNVGIATADPRYTFQVGANPNTGNGVGFNSTGSIKASGIITASSFVGDYLSGNLLGNVNSTGVGTFNNLKVGTITIGSGVITATTFRGNLVGDVTGTASTALSLSGTPSISVNNYYSTGILTTGTINSQTATITTVNSGFSTSGITTIYNALNIASLGTIGIGTDNPNADIHIIDGNNGASIQLTSDGSNEAYVAIGRSITRTQSNGELRFGNTNVSQKYSSSSSLDVINYGLGNLNNYLHLGSTTGINTGNFNWIYGKSANSPLMSLTYGGSLGIGVTIPTNTLHVVGTSTVTGNSYVGGNLSVIGNLSVGGVIVSTNGIDLNGTDLIGNVIGNLSGNVNATSGISTFNEVQVTGFSTFTNLVQLSNVGINTIPSGTYPLIVNGPLLNNQLIVDSLGNIGLGTNSFNYAPSNQYRVSIDAARGTAYLQGVSVGTTTPSCFADFSNAGANIPDIGSVKQFMLPPKISTTVRNSLVVVEGAFIYNTTNKRLEVYNGTGWCGIATIA